MIASIEGNVTHQSETHLFVHTVYGVGYKIAYSKNSFERGQKVFLYTAQTFRENGQDLYGFEVIKDLEMFEALCTVKGVGAKSAFSMINAIGPENILNAISIENKKVLTAAPGIGNKAASQIILDLQSKVTKLKYSIGASTDSCRSATEDAGPLLGEMPVVNRNLFLEDTVLACKELGFKEVDVLKKAQEILNQQEVSSSEELIQNVLKGI